MNDLAITKTKTYLEFTLDIFSISFLWHREHLYMYKITEIFYVNDTFILNMKTVLRLVIVVNIVIISFLLAETNLQN